MIPKLKPPLRRVPGPDELQRYQEALHDMCPSELEASHVSVCMLEQCPVYGHYHRAGPLKGLAKRLREKHKKRKAKPTRWQKCATPMVSPSCPTCHGHATVDVISNASLAVSVPDIPSEKQPAADDDYAYMCDGEGTKEDLVEDPWSGHPVSPSWDLEEDDHKHSVPPPLVLQDTKADLEEDLVFGHSLDSPCWDPDEEDQSHPVPTPFVLANSSRVEQPCVFHLSPGLSSTCTCPFPEPSDLALQPLAVDELVVNRSRAIPIFSPIAEPPAPMEAPEQTRSNQPSAPLVACLAVAAKPSKMVAQLVAKFDELKSNYPVIAPLPLVPTHPPPINPTIAGAMTSGVYLAANCGHYPCPVIPEEPPNIPPAPRLPPDGLDARRLRVVLFRTTPLVLTPPWWHHLLPEAITGPHIPLIWRVWPRRPTAGQHMMLTNQYREVFAPEEVSLRPSERRTRLFLPDYQYSARVFALFQELYPSFEEGNVFQGLVEHLVTKSDLLNHAAIILRGNTRCVNPSLPPLVTYHAGLHPEAQRWMEYSMADFNRSIHFAVNQFVAMGILQSTLGGGHALGQVFRDMPQYSLAQSTGAAIA